MNNYKRLTLNGNDYVVFSIDFQDYSLPVVLDWDNFKTIKDMNKRWRCNQNGFVSCSHTYNNNTKEVYLHEVVMLLKNKDNGTKNLTKSIIHINRVGLDNRKENLMYDTTDKDNNKNSKKKKRSVELPEDSGIDPDTLPTYVWYMRPDDTHGERFLVNIGDVTWKTSSSSEYSLKYKLEEAKIFVRHLLNTRKDLYNEYSMNGDYTKEGKKLLESYYDIIHKCGFKNIQKFIPENNTLEYLKPDYSALSHDELFALKKRRDDIKFDY